MAFLAVFPLKPAVADHNAAIMLAVQGFAVVTLAVVLHAVCSVKTVVEDSSAVVVLAMEPSAFRQKKTNTRGWGKFLRGWFEV